MPAQRTHHPDAPSAPDGPAPGGPDQTGPPPNPRTGLAARIRSLVRAIQENDEQDIQEAILRLSRSHRALSPLALAVGGVVLLFDGVRLLVSNWRLTLIQIVPAMWIWLAMFDLKVHVLRGRTFHVIRGPVLIPIWLAIIAITMASLFLNAVFAFAIARPGEAAIRPAVAQARRHLATILAWGAVLGVPLAFATTVATRQPHPWFGISLSIVVGAMMVFYVAVPSRLIGAKPARSRRDKLTTTAVGGALSATVCTPPYLLGRLGILMLGSKALFIPGIFVLVVGVTLQAGATGAVRAIKMSVSLLAGPDAGAAEPGAGAGAAESGAEAAEPGAESTPPGGDPPAGPGPS
jgi:hypothetical protein